MNTSFFILSMLLLASCNETLRTRTGKCLGADNRYVACSSSGDTLSTNQYRKKYIAEVTTPISVGQSQIILKDYAHDSDHDQELTCELEVAKNKQFSYTLQQEKLILTDGLSTLVLSRQSGSKVDSLEGTWSMQEVLDKVQTVTELIFNDLEEVKIRKTCNLK